MENGASSYRRFLDGEKDGIVDVIREYKDGLMLYINKFVGNIHTAEDLMEDTFVRLAVKKPKLSDNASFKTFLYSIGGNIALDYLRRQQKLVHLTDEEMSLALKDEANLERDYIKNEQKIALHKALGKINPDYAKLLYLVYFEDFEIVQAASVMKKTRKHTDTMLYRAKAALKQQLEKEGFVYEEL